MVIGSSPSSSLRAICCNMNKPSLTNFDEDGLDQKYEHNNFKNVFLLPIRIFQTAFWSKQW